ncbi:unnamed protein product [Toxocara canis]|uniref:Uncharacterized protein n=1 Tax=Toxocara canis TaxID=6265 RepID=A0A183U8S6_TOXCA|nr:unnamed protein product [Toxocara canis]
MVALVDMEWEVDKVREVEEEEVVLGQDTGIDQCNTVRGPNEQAQLAPKQTPSATLAIAKIGMAGKSRDNICG